MHQGVGDYLHRIGLDAVPPATPEGLTRLQRSHRLTIPFENLDVQLGQPILLDGDHVFNKLVTRRRGGYCFEQNRLFGDMLALMGFASRPLLARVRLRLPADALPPRTHTLLLLDFDGDHWIADAGFGGSYAPPLPLIDGAQASAPDGSLHRLRRQIGGLDGDWLLERAVPDAGAGETLAWQAQYSFEIAEVASDDLEQVNHWTSTRPGTRFTSLHIASIALEDGFAALTQHSLSLTRGGVTQTHELADPASWRDALAEHFTIELSEDEVARLPLFAG